MPELTEIEKTFPPAAEAAEDPEAGSGSDSDASEVSVGVGVLTWFFLGWAL